MALEAQEEVEISIKKYLERRFSQKITLDHLSQKFHLSRFQILRAFRRRFGITPFAYVAELRLRRASGMLLGGVPIAQVASEVGFFDQSHMAKHFKRYYGITPMQYLSEERY